MQHFFEFIGLITLIVGSILYSKEVNTVSVSADNLRQEIENKANLYKIEATDAIINNNTIILGKNGRKVNINKSYYNMKELGIFAENKLKFDTIYIKNRLIYNKDKYIISGNKIDRNITFIFNYNTNINNIYQILKKHNIKASFVTNSNYLENKNIKKIILTNNIIINNSQKKYDFIWFKKTVMKIGQKQNYCLNATNKQYSYCTLTQSYILKADLIKNNYYTYIKNNLENGKIFYFNVDTKLIYELDTIINYINNKGYKIIPLDKLLIE